MGIIQPQLSRLTKKVEDVASALQIAITEINGQLDSSNIKNGSIKSQSLASGVIPSLANPTQTIEAGDTLVGGSAVTGIRSDVQFPVSTAVAGDLAAVGTAAGAGTSTKIPRADHVHVLGTDSVVNAAIGTDAVNTDEIAANAVGASELADNAVDTAAIAASAVTNAKLGLTVTHAFASANLPLTTTETDITGATVTPGAGDYIIIANFDFNVTTGGAMGVIIGTISVNGFSQPQAALWDPLVALGRNSTPLIATALGLGAGQIIKMRAKKSAAFGVSLAMATHTNMVLIPY